MPPAAAPKQRRAQVGRTRPRLAPPVPARHEAPELVALATEWGLTLYPWQVQVARYMTARAPGGGWLWPEVAAVVARRNGKTTALETLIGHRLLKGHRVMHAAQTLRLPKETFDVLVDRFDRHHRALIDRIRLGAGQEEIRLTNGGRYRIVATTRAAARGFTNDLVVIDEALALDDHDFISAVKPTVMAEPEGQVVYVSNAGDPTSVVLNALKARADSDPALAYLEWSAPPDVAPDDLRGWLMANPAVGHNPVLLRNLEREYQSHLLGNTLDIFEREYLCRWAAQAGHLPYLAPDEWERVPATDEAPARMGTMGVKMDPSGERAAAVVAWPRADGGVAVWVAADVTGTPIDTDELGPRLRALASQLRCRYIVFDPVTDADLARHLRHPQAIPTREYAQACEKFTRLVLGGGLAVRDPEGILARDLNATMRVGSSAGTYVATKVAPDLTNTAIEAAIRAVWIASAPRPRAVVY